MKVDQNIKEKSHSQYANYPLQRILVSRGVVFYYYYHIAFVKARQKKKKQKTGTTIATSNPQFIVFAYILSKKRFFSFANGVMLKECEKTLYICETVLLLSFTYT